MKKILAFFLFSFYFSAPSFAQNNMMMQANNMLMMAAAMSDNSNQRQVQAQNAWPVVINIQYKPDGSAVVTSSTPIQVQTATSQVHECPPQDGKIREILLALVLGLFVGWMVKGMFSRIK